MHMAIDTSYPQYLINKYRIIIMIILLISLLGIMLFSILIARKGLNSLYEMANITKRITSTQLSKRLNTREWPKELTPLGQAFNQMLTGLESAFNRLNQCTAELAHELRTPINNLIIGAEITLSQQRDAEEFRQELESNLEEYKRLNNLVENILFLGQSRKPLCKKLNYQYLDIKDELTKICEFYKGYGT